MNGEYGVHLVRGAQGAWPNGTYPYGAYRKVIREMKHFSMYSLEAGRNSANDDYNISLRDMDEYYLVALRECIQQADIGAYMCSCECVHVIFWGLLIHPRAQTIRSMGQQAVEIPGSTSMLCASIGIFLE